MRHTILFLATALAATGILPAQTNPLINEVKQHYTGVKNNLIRMAENVPEDLYGFQPVSEIRTFGQLVGHVADSQTRTCAAVKGEQKQPSAASKTSKADLVAALKESFDDCDAAFGTITDDNMSEMAGRRSKLGSLILMTSHSNEEYGYMAVYLRLKGIVPPSSDRSGKK